MPTYEYLCASCAHQWEETQKISEPALDTCPKCQKPTAKRQISGGNFILKGGGWYADLYSSAKPAKKDEGAPAAKADAKSDAPAAKTPSTAPAAAPAAAASTSATSTSSTGGGSASKE